jgi:hypothetical protein
MLTSADEGMRVAENDGSGLPENGRFSFRLNAEELERVRGMMDYFTKRYPKHTKITQKLIFLEGLDAIDYRIGENARKSSARKGDDKSEPR